MRGFGRQCRGQGRGFGHLVRHTAQKLLTLGEPVKTLAHKAQGHLEPATMLSETRRARLRVQLTSAISPHEDMRHQARRLTQGKTLTPGKLVNAYDLTIAPMIKGKSNCPTPFGSKPGMASEPASGFLFATLVP